MGLIKKPSMKDYWTTNISQRTNWFRLMFARNRFQLILKFLHVCDNRKEPARNNPNYRYGVGENLYLVNQGSQVRFTAPPSLSDETLSRGPVF